MSKSSKKRPVDRVRAKLKGSLVGLASNGSLSAVTEVVPTGIEPIDYHVLACGGLPVGRIGEVFADEGAGKTSLGFAFLAAAQRAGGVAALIETEKTLELDRASVFGVDLSELLLGEPSTVEEVIAEMKTLFEAIPKGVGPNVVVWDSLAGTELSQSTPGVRARLMSESLPILGRLARDRRVAVVIINQIREKIGVMFGPKETTPGGHSLKHQATWRLQAWRGAEIKTGGAPSGIYTTVKCAKSKVAAPFRKAKLLLDFESGWDNDWAMMNLGKDLKILKENARKSAANVAVVRSWLCGSPNPATPDEQ